MYSWGELLMTDNNLSFEILCLILFTGVVVSTIIRRKTGVNPGGVITAPFLVFSFYFSYIWGLTIVLLSYLISKIYNKYFSHIYQGRNPTYIIVFISMLFVYAATWFYSYFQIIPDLNINFIYGLIIPGIIALALRKQDVKKTYIYTFISLIITVLVSFILYFILVKVFNYNFFNIEKLRYHSETLTLHYGFFLSLISIITSFIIYHFTKIKSGGYIVLPYIAMLLFNFKNLAIFFTILIMIHLITKMVRSYTLLFGINRYVFVLCMAILLVWITEVIGLRLDPTFTPFMSVNILPILALASITNDFSTQKLRNTAPLLLINLSVVGLAYQFFK